MKAWGRGVGKIGGRERSGSEGKEGEGWEKGGVEVSLEGLGRV